MASLIEQLRKIIDAKHAEALRSLDNVGVYVPEAANDPCGQKRAGKKASAKATAKKAPRSGTGKIRPRVLDAMGDRSMTIQEIATETGLTAAQVRGAVLSVALKDRFTKKPDAKRVMYYKYNPPAGEEE